uniref:AAA+ ATPase domain-containing protein n=2 Tax=Percolomonas cosmopolitus TaxID=63605 RepID=A0A7S1KLW9_9EUKA|mmetsp:Transcript_11539/g.43294  ORF Transcript_11539/g.43294 Transcript_11539/m.43294 type:complete len:4570 (+) Transcript_11539:260-13969(+)|eukprot:CAMPEP_0117450680 /NCGR_PEP_ID=MMETSP0759-20121206/8598_1 /TAXON_ID=63605 /ORGANISM="Percolomonas cosmopolitus, Strain WS" /LENGTH=4569 /DNA_ID=CAMNT_0005243219 /DNA_START=252 /DNA_END=13961 /DNA_ORIENTATION=-
MSGPTSNGNGVTSAKPDKRHEYIFQKVSDALNIDLSTVQNVGCFQPNLQCINNFLASNGPQTLLWFYDRKSAQVSSGEDGDEEGWDTATVRSGLSSSTMLTSNTHTTSFFTGESQTSGVTPKNGDSTAPVPKSEYQPILCVANDAQRYALMKGQIAYFLKKSCKDKISTTNIMENTIFGTIDGRTGLLDELKRRLEEVMLPTLKSKSAWGELSGDGIDSKLEIEDFLDQVERFVNTLSESINSLNSTVVLSAPKKNFGIEARSKSYQRASQRPEIVQMFEEKLTEWSEQIETILSEGKDRAELDEKSENGPHVELEYWKQRMAKFNSITDQLKQRRCKIVLGVLKYAKSGLLQDWKELDMKITDAANEAKDNVKYLYILEKFSEPLYKTDPVKMIASIPGLINAIKMMHSIARYYNTSERMTSLFVKITNQMITCCKKYITRDGSLWGQDVQTLVAKFKACIDLNEAYQHYYRKTREELAQNPYGKQFDFSEQTIFGRFDAFCWRIQKLIDMFNTIHQFQLLANSKIENIQPITDQFKNVLTSIQGQSYDFLDHKNKQFEEDFVRFNQDMSQLEAKLVIFINNCFGSATSTQHSLEMLRQFREVLKQDSLQRLLDEKHKIIFNNYGRDVEGIKQIYEKFRKRPPLPRNSPPVAGNIAWARQLLRKIEDPMKLFQQTSAIRTKDARRIIKMYNKLAVALVHFERLWYEKWLEVVRTARDGLHATLLVRHPQTGMIHVNFDNHLLRLIKEVTWLERMGFDDIPDSAYSVANQEDRLLSYSEKLKYMLSEYYRVISLPNDIVKPLVGPMIEAAGLAVEPGLHALTWMSLSIDQYLERVFEQLEILEDVVTKANNIVEFRLNTNCDEISKASLIKFFSKVKTIDTFVTAQQKHAAKVSEQINIRNKEIEAGVNDLIVLVTSMYTPQQTTELSDQLIQTKDLFEEKVFSSIVVALQNSVSLLKYRILGTTPHDGESTKPVFSAQIELDIPYIKLRPPLSDIQRSVNRCARYMLESTKNIGRWSHHTDAPDEDSVYDKLGEHRSTIQSFMQLTDAVSGLSNKIDEFISSLDKYHYLWKENRGEIVSNFKARSPSIEEFERKIAEFSQVEKELKDRSKHEIMGSLALDLKPITDALRTEAAQWKHAFGQSLNAKAKERMSEMSTFMEDTKAVLLRPANDLETLNMKMQTIEQMRDQESKIDTILKPIEECYSILHRYNIEVSKEESDVVDSMEYNWSQLVKLSRTTMSDLQRVGPKFRRELLADIITFKKDVEEFKDSYDKHGPMRKGITPREAIKALKKYGNAYEERERKWNTYTMGESLFGLPQTSYPELQQIQGELQFLNRLYELYRKVIITVQDFEAMNWSDLDTELMGQKLEEFAKGVKTMPKGLTKWDAYIELKDTIDKFQETLPLLESLNEPYVKERHWAEIEELCNAKLDYKNPEFKVKNIMEGRLVEHKDDIEEVVNAAQRQQDIETKLNQIKLDWGPSGHKFVLGSFKNRGNLMLKDMGEILQEMEDAQLMLSGLVANMFNKPFKKEIQEWLKRLTVTQSVIDDWLKVQALWVYLEAVFTGGDIAKELPTVAKRFSNVDRSWVKIMTTVEAEPNIVKMCYSNEMLRELLPHLKENLEKCQKSLSGYLESKRMIFPRFFFLSDGQLLEILGQGSDPTTIQPHLLSIFANIGRVSFDAEKKNKIVRMTSAEGEPCDLKNGLVCQGNVEDWLNKLVDEMRDTVAHRIRLMNADLVDYLAEADKDKFQKFINKYLSQVSLLGIQIFWTLDSENAIRNSKTERGIMQNTRKKFEALLSHLIDFTTIATLTKLERRRIETLITIHIHQVEIFQHLCQKRIKSVSHFDWLKQTRFYWKPEDNEVPIRITDINFKYCNEFLGTTSKLVITPLTDRIYISCAQAMGMFLGGAPAGPAGTGKTETTKDMGGTLGKFFITINCSDQMNYTAMGLLFKGISQGGVWVGFDEVNRIYVEVLSVVAAQIKCVFDALKNRNKRFTFVDGTELSLDAECGLFVTMNPGYAGRTELPENMKRLFRTIAVVVPDRQIIMKVKLASAGFQENIPLSRKFFMLYRLCEEQLSKQIHYDFGLRNILSVLRTCGSVLRGNKDMSESKVLMRVLRDMNISKMVDEDSILFLELIKDLFPGEKVKDSAYPDMQKHIAAILEEKGLTNHPDWNLRVIQIFEQYNVRHGVCIMGPSGGGKSSSIFTLCEALCRSGTVTKIKKMNPKAITASQMFGILDQNTNDWTDGIFSALWRMSAAKTKEHSWILLDGPVDTLWIENLNTVLDDTRTLTLANGDRLIMPPTLKLFFEVSNLDNASPATVSRLGMVYIGLSALGWQPIFEAWTNKYRKQKKFLDILGSFKQLFETHIDLIQEFVELELEPVMAVHKVNVVSSTMRLLDGLLLNEDKASISAEHAERFFVFSVVWSIGALLEDEDRIKLHKFLQKRKLDLPQIDVSSKDTVFSYVTDSEGKWEHWDNRVPRWEYPKDHSPKFHDILVPTVDNVRQAFLIDMIASQKLPVLVIGKAGTAKTVTLQQYIQSQDKKKIQEKFLSFSSATTPALYQKTIFTALEKRMSNQFGPPVGKWMMIFIDDINMPFINDWGDQITNEIVRQSIEDNGFFSLEPSRAGDWLHILDVQFFGAMNHPGGGRNDIPERLKRHFSIFNMTFPNDTSIDKIFGTIAQGHFSGGRGFSESVVKTTKSIASMTRVLWDRTRRKMLPTPMKFHYVFNLRDLSRIFQGMLVVIPDIVKSPFDLVSLWKHECERVLSDKFVEDMDHAWFHETIIDVIRDNLGDELAEQNEEPQYYVDFLRELTEEDIDPEAEVIEQEEPKVYEPVPKDNNLKKLHTRLTGLMNQFNEQNKRLSMNLVLFQFAMEHIMRISRIIRTDRGNALLVGVGGSGKQSLTRLASFIAGYETFKLKITKTYGINQLLEDLCNLYKIAAHRGVTFLFTDNDVKDEQFLEYLNMILISGEIPGLFSKEDRDILMEELRPIAVKSQPNFMATPDNMYKFLINTVRDNLHVVLCFSPVGETLRERARKFPGLISGCNVNWFPSWPLEALHATAASFLSDFEIVHSGDQKKELVNYMCNAHEKVVSFTKQYFERFRRNTYVTPKSYLGFIESYKTIYTSKITEIKNMADTLNKGLSKLLQASKDVEKMKINLKEQEKNLEIAVRKADVLLTEVTKKKIIAEKDAAEVQVQADKLSADAAVIAEQKASAEKDLEAAKPALEKAEAALQNVNAKDLNVVKALGKPPPLVKLVMDGVIIIMRQNIIPIQVDQEFFENKKTKGRRVPLASWESAKKMMSDMNFIKKVKDFDKDSLDDETIELLYPYVSQPDFNFEAVCNSSQAVAGLCQWVVCMTEYFAIAKEVAPKRKRVREAEQELAAAMKKLNKAKGELAKKQAELDKMKAKLDEAMSEKKALEDDANRTKKRMESAEALINGLSGERDRWTEDSKRFDDRIRRLIGDVAIVATFLSYAGPFNQEFRAKLIEELAVKDLTERNIPMSDTVDVINFLTTPTQIGEWTLQSLPNDSHSQQNAIIMTKGSRFPLLIDPQGQGKTWIVNKEKDLEITSIQDKRFKMKLESCLTLGRPMLIEDVGEELDPMLDPVLEKQIVQKGKHLKIKLGDDEVNYDERFFLYITTKLPNPNYTPEIFARASVIDFTVTAKGLEDQLLSIVIIKEKNELEKKRQNLMNEIQNCKQIMADCEAELLDKLSNAKGQLVDDTELIDVLNKSQERAEEMKVKLSTASITEKEITEAREEFRPVATRGSVMYFVITELSLINVMYNISLKEFIRLFIESIENAPKDRNTQKRIQHVITATTYDIYKYVQRGLYEKDKKTYALLLALKINLRSNDISQAEFKFLLQGGAALNLNEVRKRPYDWLTDSVWLNINALIDIPQFKAIIHQLEQNEKAWKQYYDHAEPETIKDLPDGYKLSAFHRLLLIRTWRSDRTVKAASDYIEETLGKRFVNSIPLNLAETWKETTPITPVVCLLSQGTDLSGDIEQLAEEMKMPLNRISMGQGQAPQAHEYVKNGIANGGWVLLQNCHLGIDYLEVLEPLLMDLEEQFEKGEVDETFRIWITSEPTDRFPINLLQMSIKCSDDPPTGVKAGLMKSYTWINQQLLDKVDSNEWKQLLFTVCFVHSVLIERKKFGPLGWCVPYEFNSADLECSVLFLQRHMYEFDVKKMQWDTIRYMIGAVQYGGRITDDFDQRLLDTFCDKWINKKVFSSGFEFFKGYDVPLKQKVQEYRDYISENLPLFDHPEVFGLHGNAEITFNEMNANKVLGTILNVQPKQSSGGGGETRESVVLKIAESHLERLPEEYNMIKVRKQLNKTDPLTIFLKQEIQQMNRVIVKIKQTLEDLKLGIAGTIVMNTELQDALNYLYDAKVPPKWQKISWESPTLGYWFTDVIARSHQFTAWLEEGRPKIFWLSGFFNPLAFLTAIKQEATRAHTGWSLETVSLKTEVTKKDKDNIVIPKDAEGVYIHGIYLEGAAWDKKAGKLIDPSPKILFTELPVLHIVPVNIVRNETTNTNYQCPTYLNPKRTDLNYVFDIELKSDRETEFWVCRGVAALLSVR